MLTVSFMLIAGITYIADVFIEDNNFRILSPQAVYRSAQISGNDWNEIYAEHPFKSVLNLRGDNTKASWYQQELAFTNQQEIKHYNLSLSANHQPDMATMEKLVSIMREAPQPMLVHCKQGADRSGLAAALYIYAIEGKSADEAAKQLSILYGHFPWITSRTGAMDRAFEAYVKAHPQGKKA